MSLTGGSKFILTGGANYQIARSLRFRASNSNYLTRTTGTSTDAKKCTLSVWFKPSVGLPANIAFFLSGNSVLAGVGLDNGNGAGLGAFRLWSRFNGSSGYQATNWLIRDPSAWYHLVYVQDTSAGVNNRVKMWLNGVAATWNSYTDPTLNDTTNGLNVSSTGMNIGSYDRSTASYMYDGYMAEYYFVDGQALDQTYFGKTDATTGAWNPIKYTGTYGTNGFYLPFSDNSAATSTTIGKDSSGNGNNWTPSGISVTAGVTNDSLVDVPTNYGTDTGAGGEVRGNYCTWVNPGVDSFNTTLIGLSNGNLTATGPGRGSSKPSIFPSSGKWYAEFTVTTKSTSTQYDLILNLWGPAQASAQIYGEYEQTGGIYSGSWNPAFAAWAVNDVISIAWDIDSGTVRWYKNGTQQGTGFSFTAGSACAPYVYMEGGNTSVVHANFGQRPWVYSNATLSLSGFKALCTQNLPDPAIPKPSLHFDIDLYTGTGATRTKTGLLFQPDFAWFKGRSGATAHAMYDVARGVQKDQSIAAAVQTTEATGLTAFTTDGYTIGALASLNTSAASYVAWLAKFGGATVSNTNGSITAQVSANVLAGMSIAKYTGNGSVSTVGHGLPTAPKLIIFKMNSTTGYFPVYHASLGANGKVFLNTTDAYYADLSFNNTAPTSSVFTTAGAGYHMNTNGEAITALCFAEVAGFSKFGSYTGNGSADGPFVFTNMLPRYILIKRTDSTSDWYIWDTARDTYNVESATLLADSSGAETSAASIDGLSNGFKCRSSTVVNASGGTYIYAAFASSPFKYSRAR